MPAERLHTWATAWASRRSARIGGVNPFLVAVRTVRASQRDRVTGLAAEMAFFALLSLIPAVVALGAGLSLLERFVGAAAVDAGRRGAVGALGAIFAPEVHADVIEPLVDGLLEGERGGIAVSSLLVSLFLASRVLTATIRALDAAYDVERPRNLLQQRIVAFVLAIFGVVVVTLSLVVAVVGPLFGTGQDLAARLGLGELTVTLWRIARWPAFALVAVGFFATVYRVGPNVAHRWRDGLPGAVLGVGLWLAASVGFRTYLETVGTPGAQFAPTEEGVAILGQVVGAVVAAVLWTFLSGISLLVGGELNSEIRIARRGEGAAARGKVGADAAGAGTPPARSPRAEEEQP